MNRKSDTLQNQVRSAQGEIAKNEFQLCNLRRITSAREPLAVEQEHRKISPIRRKLRKTYNCQQASRFLANVYPNHLVRDYASIEDKPPCSRHESSLQISKYNSHFSDVKLDAGPTELIYSAPYEFPSAFSSQSTLAVSCSSVPTSYDSINSFDSKTTIKNTEVREKKENVAEETEMPRVPEVKPSIAFQKCCKNDFRNVEDIIKLSPREQTLLPRSLYLAAQLAATPNVNYSEKYGFRAFCDSKWISPRTIAFNLRAKSTFKHNIAIPDYFKEASHPLTDLRLIARPWWVPNNKNIEKVRRTSEVTKYELFAENRGLFDCRSATDFANNTMHEISDYEYEKRIDMYEGNTQRALFQELASESKETIKSVDETVERKRNCYHAKSRHVQTYITFPCYTDSRVEFWSDSNDSNANEFVFPIDHRRGAEYEVKTNTCGINTYTSDYEHETNSNEVFMQRNNSPPNITTLPQINNSLVYRYYKDQILRNMNHQYSLVPEARHVQSPIELKNCQLRSFMTNGNPMNGTGDTGESVISQNYLIPVTGAPYIGGSMSKMIRNIGLRSISSLNANMPQLTNRILTNRILTNRMP